MRDFLKCEICAPVAEAWRKRDYVRRITEAHRRVFEAVL